MENATPTPPTTADGTPAPSVKVVSPAVGVVGLAWGILTPVLAMYAVGYRGGNFVVSILAFILTLGAIFVFLHPKGPLFIANKVAAIAARIVLSAGILALLVTNGLPVWAVIYGVLSVAVVWAVRRVHATPATGSTPAIPATPATTPPAASE